MQERKVDIINKLITIKTEGADETAALEEIVALINNRFDEEV